MNRLLSGTGMGACRRSTSSSPRHYLVAALCAAVVVASGCSESGDDVEAAQERVANAEEAVADAKADLEEAGAAFCAEAKDYIAAIDRYGKAFDDEAATVGDIETLGADMGRPRDSTVDAGEAVLEAHDTVNDANEELTEARTRAFGGEGLNLGQLWREGETLPHAPSIRALGPAGVGRPGEDRRGGP